MNQVNVSYHIIIKKIANINPNINEIRQNIMWSLTKMFKETLAY